jgi:hypothetical protein
VTWNAQSLGWRRHVNASIFINLHSQPHLEQICRVFAAIWPRSMGNSRASAEYPAGQGVKKRESLMTKLFAGAAAAILFAGVAFAGEPATETEAVEAEAAVEAVEAEATVEAEAAVEAVEAEAVEAAVEAEAEVAPAEAVAEEAATEEAAAE